MQPFLLPIISKLTVRSIIDILALAILIYQFVVIIRGRHAAHILTGLGVLLAVYLIAVWAHLDLLRTVLSGIAPYTAFALIVMFQSEIRRLLSRKDPGAVAQIRGPSRTAERSRLFGSTRTPRSQRCHRPWNAPAPPKA